MSVSHCFALNGNIFDPSVDGIDEVSRYYKNAIENTNLSGPTNFADIIEEVNNIVASHNVTQDSQKHHILVILTDG